MYTVGEVSKISGVSVKTLHHYQKIGLLEPAEIGENNYRYYGTAEIDRLQSILFYRTLEIPLQEIRAILDEDAKQTRVEVLKQHLELLHLQQVKMEVIVQTLEDTLKVEEEMLSMNTVDKKRDALTQEEKVEKEQEKFKGFKPKDDVMIATSNMVGAMAKPNAIQGLVLCGIMLFIGVVLLIFGAIPQIRQVFFWLPEMNRGAIAFVGVMLIIYGGIGCASGINILFFTKTKDILTDINSVRYKDFSDEKTDEDKLDESK